jgi:O-antigen/teichoic acid export membrane protein
MPPSPAPATDSVGKGALSIGGGRLIGMAIAFLLMTMLTRRSQQDIGVFRTLATFLLIAETVPLLGMHRWLATQMGTNLRQRGLHFASSSVWASATAVVLALIYVGIALSGAYDREVSRGLLLIAMATIPSSTLLVVQASLIGIGRSAQVGLLNLAENGLRSAIGVGLVLAGFDVLSLIVVFVMVRWGTGVAGFRMVRAAIGPLDWRRPFEELFAVRGVVPRMAGVMLCALALRNAALVILPSLSNISQTGLFAVSYQLADLAMLVPTVLALSSTFVMARDASYAKPHLRRTMFAMTSVLAILLFPVTGLAVALAGPTLELLFGRGVLAAVPTFQIMMLATPLMAVDQVLSQGMVSTQRYTQDLWAISLGAGSAIALTLLLGQRWGAVGAAAAFLVSMGLSLLARVWLMRDLRIGHVFVHATWRAGCAALLCAALTAWASTRMLPALAQPSRLLLVIPGVLLYAAAFLLLGGASPRSRRRILHFMSHREA